MKKKSNPKVGERRSARRDAILETLENASGALTAEELHEKAVELVPGLGIATVYRNLKKMQEADIIQSVILPDGQTRYEPSKLKHHHHFHCSGCGKTLCLKGCMLPEDLQLSLPEGFTVNGHEITLYGTCATCSK